MLLLIAMLPTSGTTSDRPWVRAKLHALLGSGHVAFQDVQTAGNRVFFLRHSPPDPQPVLLCLDGTNRLSTARTLLNPSRGASGARTAIAWYAPSPDGSRVAVCVAEEGREWGVLQFQQVDPPQPLPDVLPQVSASRTGAGAVWNAGGTGVTYLRCSRPDESRAAGRSAFLQVRSHSLGTPATSDLPEPGPEFQPMASVDLKSSLDHEWILASATLPEGDGMEHWLRSPRGGWKQLTQPDDAIGRIHFGRHSTFVEWGRDDALYALAARGSPLGRIVRIPLRTPDFSNARVVVPEGTNLIVGFRPSASGVFTTTRRGGTLQLHFHDRLAGTNRLVFPRPATSADADPPASVNISDLVVQRGDRLIFRQEHYLNPARYSVYDPNENASSVVDFVLRDTANASFDDVEATTEFSTSEDGLPISLTILRKKGATLDGSLPTVLVEEGWLGLHGLPTFDPARRLWFDQGGVLAVAHARTTRTGGSQATKAGSGDRRTEDELDAGASKLISLGYTRSGRMVVHGHSVNGGLRADAASERGVPGALPTRLDALVNTYTFLLRRLGVVVSLVERGPWSGGVTDRGAVVKARLAHPGLRARLLWSEDPDLRHPQRTPAQVSQPDGGLNVSFALADLKPGIRHYYRLEVEGRKERAKQGAFTTLPPKLQPASFDFAFASCGRTGSTNASYDRIRERDPLFYINAGDFHYEDIGTNWVPRFRQAYDRVLSSPQQARLYRQVPLVYVWDDHDFGGNGTGRWARSREAARLAYRECVPHHSLAAGPGDASIHHSFSVGRVKFILTDLRSERDSVTNRDDGSKSMMGSVQKEWFKQELLSARGRFPLIFWVSSVPWLGTRGSNYYANIRSNHSGFIHETNRSEWMSTNASARAAATNRTASTNAGSTRGTGGRRGTGGAAASTDEDHWSMFATERREIADFIRDNHITGVCILHGDAHSLAADDGRNGDFSTGGGIRIPIMAGAPLDQNTSVKGGPYSQGVYRVRRGEGAFGLVSVTDHGSSIDAHFRGVTSANEEVIQLKISVPADPPHRISSSTPSSPGSP